MAQNKGSSTESWGTVHSLFLYPMVLCDFCKTSPWKVTAVTRGVEPRDALEQSPEIEAKLSRAPHPVEQGENASQPISFLTPTSKY